MSNDEGFRCPACSYRMNVIDSRATKLNDRQAVRRRRHCPNCNTRITTYEIAGAQDVEDLRFSLGRIMSMARMARSALVTLLDEYDKMGSKR